MIESSIIILFLLFPTMEIHQEAVLFVRITLPVKISVNKYNENEILKNLPGARVCSKEFKNIFNLP